MALPGVSLDIQKFGLGIVLPGAGRIQVKAGACSKGTPGVLYSVGSTRAVKDAVGSGPLYEAALQALDHPGAGGVKLLPVAPTVAGEIVDASGVLTLEGQGDGTVTASLGPEQVIKVKIHTAGGLGVGKFQIAIGSGAYGVPVEIPAGGFYRVPGAMFTLLAFATNTYDADDVYTLNLDGTIDHTGTGGATDLDNTAHSPVDAYRIRVKITTAGERGAGAFKWSLDGGNHYDGPALIPATGVFVIPGTGVVLTFSDDDFVKDDVYSGSTTAPDYDDDDLTDAIDDLLAAPDSWGFLHVVGTPSDADAAKDRADAVESKMESAEAKLRYVHAITECPGDGTDDADVKTAFAEAAYSRVAVCVGDADMINPGNGRSDKRNAAWTVSARLGAISISTNPGQVNLGPLHNVTGIYRDEDATPGLDDAAFVTLRKFPGLKGYFVTDYHMLDEPGSDFRVGPNRRVMDEVCTQAVAAYTLYVNSKVRVDKTTGFIDERDAQAIDRTVTAKIQAAVQGEVSDVKAVLHRDDNLLSTSTVHFDIGVVPLGYLRRIEGTVGFRNPALTTPGQGQ